jgi:uncharacterized protein (DUF58 family)
MALPTEYLSGAYANQQDLIGLRFVAERLKISQRKQRRAAQLLGSNHSVFKGRGLEFAEVRQYQGGDEIRHIDWRVTARTSVPHTKLFQEEKERPVILCLDQRQSMFFGSRHCFKSVLAANTAALLAWTGLQNNDRVGGLVFNDSAHTEIRPRRSKRAVLHFIQSAADYNAQLNASNTAPSASLDNAFEELRRITKPGSTVFICSDFYGFDAAAIKNLHQIARHNSVYCLCIRDPLEAELPALGQFAVSDGAQTLHLQSGKKLSQFFDQAMADEKQQRELNLLRSGIHLINLSTADLWQDVLRRELHL